MNLRLHLLRHAQAEPETPWRFLGQRDRPLSQEGEKQARFWRDALAGTHFTAALCSDLSRCVGTARIVLERHDIQAISTPGLREISLGSWDGLTVEEVRTRYPGQYEARGYDMAGFAPPGGESFLDLQRRALASLLPVLETAGGDVLLVAHAGVNRVLVCHFLGMPLEGLFRLGQGSCCRNVVEWGRDGPCLKIFNQPPFTIFPA